MESLLIINHTHEVVALNSLLPACWKAVVILQDLALRFSDPGRKTLFVQSWQQQSDCLTELESKIWEMGGETDPKTYDRDGRTIDPEEDPPDPITLNRILLLRSINHLTHLMHIYSEVRRTTLPFDVRMLLQRQQLRIREMLEHMTLLYLTFPIHSRVFQRPGLASGY